MIEEPKLDGFRWIGFRDVDEQAVGGSSPHRPWDTSPSRVAQCCSSRWMRPGVRSSSRKEPSVGGGRHSGMAHRMRRPRVLATVIVGCLLTAACGSDQRVATEGPGQGNGETSSSGTWTAHALGTAAADREPVGAAAGDDAAVLVVEEPGRLRGFTLRAGRPAEEAPVDAAATGSRTVAAMAGGPAGLLALGSDLSADFRTFVLSSQDGSSWSEVEATGLDAPMDVMDLIATSERYVAVGTLRGAGDPAAGGFVPVILTSRDGVTWSRSQTPGGHDGSIRSVVATAEGLIAVGFVDGAGVAWSSTDGGSTWAFAPGPPRTNQVVISGDTVLAAWSGSEEEGELTLHRSVDAGTSWEPVDTTFAEGFGFASLSGDAAGFSILTAERYRDASSSPETCYADIERCGPRSSVDDEAILVSPDGITWERLDLTGLDGLFRPSSLLHTPTGDTVVLGRTDDGSWGAWVWAASQGPAPVLPAVGEEVPVYEGPPILEHGATLEAGRRYAFPLYIHCGMDHLGELDGRAWALVDAPTGDAPEVGAGEPLPEDWPVVGQSILGFVTLAAEDRIEYSLADGQVIAVYEPIPASEVPGCD